MAALPSTSFLSSSDMSSVFSDSNRHRNDRRRYSRSDRDIDSLKMTEEEPTPAWDTDAVDACIFLILLTPIRSDPSSLWIKHDINYLIPENIFEEKVKKKMKRLAALIASAGCAFMGLCDFALSREYE